MAGNCNAACAEGYLSLAKERIRVAPKTQQLFPILKLNALPLSQGRSTKRKRLHYFEFTRTEHADLATPNILWLAGVESPSNCVFFTCNPHTPTVLTS